MPSCTAVTPKSRVCISSPPPAHVVGRDLQGRQHDVVQGVRGEDQQPTGAGLCLGPRVDRHGGSTCRTAPGEARNGTQWIQDHWCGAIREQRSFRTAQDPGDRGWLHSQYSGCGDS